RDRRRWRVSTGTTRGSRGRVWTAPGGCRCRFSELWTFRKVDVGMVPPQFSRHLIIGTGRIFGIGEESEMPLLAILSNGGSPLTGTTMPADSLESRPVVRPAWRVGNVLRSTAHTKVLSRVVQSVAVHMVNITRKNLRRSEEHTSELQSRENLVCRLL